MKLDHLLEERCPHCNAETTEITKKNRHCNGGYFETRTYACGFRVSWSPNIDKQETTAMCQRSPDYRHIVDSRKAAVAKIQNYIKRMRDVDDKFKRHAIESANSFIVRV